MAEDIETLELQTEVCELQSDAFLFTKIIENRNVSGSRSAKTRFPKVKDFALKMHIVW